MTPGQEAHLQSIKDEFSKRVDEKYRAGQQEHGGNLYDQTNLELLDQAIKEALDQFTYLITLRKNLTTQVHDK